MLARRPAGPTTKPHEDPGHSAGRGPRAARGGEGGSKAPRLRLSSLHRRCPRRDLHRSRYRRGARGRAAGVRAQEVRLPRLRVCFPAIAANAFAEARPSEAGDPDLCPTEGPEVREGWPALAGDYRVVRYQAPVAVCALNSGAVATALAERAPEGLSIVGTMHTENLGIERVIRNVLDDPHIRFLVVCGEDTQKAVGHLPGQSISRSARTGSTKACGSSVRRGSGPCSRTSRARTSRRSARA